jgi:hypothetical protein
MDRIIRTELEAAKQQLRQEATLLFEGNPDEQAFFFELTVPFERQQNEFEGAELSFLSSDLFLAFARAIFDIRLLGIINREFSLVSLRIQGEVRDLQDFNFNEGGLSTLGATVQAGFGTLQIPLGFGEGSGGRVAAVRVSIDRIIPFEFAF